jgi:transcriptional regulator of acetoin/glycerol metabolism
MQSYADSFLSFERVTLTHALAETQGDVEDAARRLGISRATLYKKLKKLGIASH